MPDWKKLTRTVQRSATKVFAERELFTYTPHNAAALDDVLGIFRDAFEASEIAVGDLAVATVGPVVHVRESDLPRFPVVGHSPATTDHLTRKRTGVEYRVSRIEPDGEGMLTLYLKESPAGQS